MAPAEPQASNMATIQARLAGHLNERVSIISKMDNRFDGTLQELDDTTTTYPIVRLGHVKFCGPETRGDGADRFIGETFNILKLKVSEIKDAFAHTETCEEMKADGCIVECTSAVLPILWNVDGGADSVRDSRMYPFGTDNQPEAGGSEDAADVADEAEFFGLFQVSRSLATFVSKAQIRYEGVIKEVDAVNGTVLLETVCMKGTEDRKCDRFIPERGEVYGGVRFRFSEMRDIRVFVPLSEELRRDPILEHTEEPVQDSRAPFADRAKNLGYLHFTKKNLELLRANVEEKKKQAAANLSKLSARSSRIPPQFTVNGNNRLTLQVGDLNQSPRSLKLTVPQDHLNNLMKRSTSADLEEPVHEPKIHDVINTRLSRAAAENNGQSSQSAPEVDGSRNVRRKRPQTSVLEQSVKSEVVPETSPEPQTRERKKRKITTANGGPGPQMDRNGRKSSAEARNQPVVAAVDQAYWNGNGGNNAHEDHSTQPTHQQQKRLPRHREKTQTSSGGVESKTGTSTDKNSRNLRSTKKTTHKSASKLDVLLGLGLQCKTEPEHPPQTYQLVEQDGFNFTKLVVYLAKSANILEGRLAPCPIEGCTDTMMRRSLHQVKSHLAKVHGDHNPPFNPYLGCAQCGQEGFHDSVTELKDHIRNNHPDGTGLIEYTDDDAEEIEVAVDAGSGSVDGL